MPKPAIPPGKPDGRKENAATTQAALRAAGRKLFGRLGYEATSVGALCAEAGVTTGALYHHYRDKKGLFAAVAEELDAGLVQRALDARTAALGRRGGDAWKAFLAGFDSVLEAGADPSGRRIGLTDAAAVLGTARWIEIRERHGLGAMMRTVSALQNQGLMVDGDPRRLARLVLGLLYGAIEALPEKPDAAAAALAETRRVTHALLAGLRRSGPARARKHQAAL